MSDRTGRKMGDDLDQLMNTVKDVGSTTAASFGPSATSSAGVSQSMPDLAATAMRCATEQVASLAYLTGKRSTQAVGISVRPVRSFPGVRWADRPRRRHRWTIVRLGTPASDERAAEERSAGGPRRLVPSAWTSGTNRRPARGIRGRGLDAEKSTGKSLAMKCRKGVRGRQHSAANGLGITISACRSGRTGNDRRVNLATRYSARAVLSNSSI